MIRKFFFTFLCLFGIVSLISFKIQSDNSNPMDRQADNLLLILNMDNQKVLPRNFRMTRMSDELYNATQQGSLSTVGLFELNASASGQFSQQGLEKILELIPSNHILLLDLREESHGFINGIAVSWYSEKDWGNRGKNLK